MSVSSDIEIIEVEDDMDEFYENDIEEVIVGSSCSEDENPLESEFKSMRKEQTQSVEKERKDEIYKCYDFLQTAILALDEIPSTKWKRSKTLNKGILLCQDLMKEEVNLMVEAEALLQENWQLKKRVEKLKRKKKRKTGPIPTRRVSGPVVGTPQSISPERKRASLDESKIKVISDKEPVIIVCKEEVQKVIVNRNKNRKRKCKKRSGLSEEEKEFYLLEEKIEDLLFEVDALWNEVDDDEEEEEDVKQEMEISTCETPQELNTKLDNSSECKIEMPEPNKKGLENITTLSCQITPPMKEECLETGVKYEKTFPVTLQSEKNIQRLESEPTTSICEEPSMGKETDCTEVINISDGSDSESSVVCIG